MIKPQNLLPNLSPRQPLEDEYISETDGLIYCSKCHTPRQKKIEFLGKIMFPIIRCQCQQEQYEKEEAKRKHQEFLEHISRLKSYDHYNKSDVGRIKTSGRFSTQQDL